MNAKYRAICDSWDWSIKKAIRICFRFITVVSIFVFLFSLFAGQSIARIFAENNNNVFELTKAGFPIFSFRFLFSGCNIFASALFTALSNGKISAAISFLRTFGLITVNKRMIKKEVNILLIFSKINENIFWVFGNTITEHCNLKRVDYFSSKSQYQIERKMRPLGNDFCSCVYSDLYVMIPYVT